MESPKDIINSKVNNMSKDQLKERQVYAVALGFPVSHSSVHNSKHNHYQIDYSKNPACWQAQYNQMGEWIQVHSPSPQLWTGLILQGRGGDDNWSAWTKTIKVSYSVNGKNWKYVDDGKDFIANTDRNTKVDIDFKNPVFARTIRIYPQKWHEAVSLRFEAIFVDMAL